MPGAKEVKRALARVRAAMPREKQVASTHRNIRLGLERIVRVVPDQQSWTGVHVGGTNGKGSICALLSGLFKLSGLSHGTFTSPAVPERHNGVTINGLYVNRRMYELELEHIKAHFQRVASGWTFAHGEDPGELTPFELDTAAAFRIFNKMHVKYGIVEVGMGGATDATNAMKEKAVTVISKIDLDHQEYLGNTIEEIAKVKAGIMRPGVPCIVDDSNPVSVLNVLREHASSIGTHISPSWKGQSLLEKLDTDQFKLEDYQRQNLLCAALAFRHLCPNLEMDLNALLASKPFPPGRMESVGVRGLTGGSRQEPILVDGAHNMLGVEALAKYVDNNLRSDGNPVSWVLGLSASKSKPFAKLIETMVRPQDNVAFVEYTQGPNDPPSVPAELGRDYVRAVVSSEDQVYDPETNNTSNLQPAIQWACDKAGSGPVILAGSLYLIRGFFKLDGIKQTRQLKTRRPGPSQLWHYIQESQKRPLTPEEAREFKRARRHWHLSPLRNPTFRQVRDGGKPASPPVPDEVRELQRNAAYHSKQAAGYRSALSSIENDLKGSAGEKPDDAGSDLRQNAAELKKLRDEHLREYNTAMYRIRGHVAEPDKKHMSYKQVFGPYDRPKKKVYPPIQPGDIIDAQEAAKYGAREEDETGDTHPRRKFSFDLSNPSYNGLDGGRRPSRFSWAMEDGRDYRQAKLNASRDTEQPPDKERIAREAQALVDKITRRRRTD